MSTFSAEKALVSGFRVIGRNPMAFLAWAGVYLVFGLAPQALIWTRLLPQVTALSAQQTPDPQAMATAMSGIAVWYPVLFLLGITLLSVLYGAIYRAVLEPEDRRYFYLRLSSRELWLGLTVLSLLVVFLIGWMVLVVALALIGHSAPGIVTFIAVVAAIIGMIWLMMRFSLAAPMAFAERRFIFMESWGLTAGHALKLFGVALALVVILIVAEMAVVLPFGLAFGLTHAFRGEVEDPSQILAHAAPWLVLGCLALALFAAFIYTVFGAPWADIYQQLTAPTDKTAT